MSRKVYTYTDLNNLPEYSYFQDISRYPFITVSSAMKWNFQKGIFQKKIPFITDISSIKIAIDNVWKTEHAKFNQSVIISEYIRQRISKETDPDSIRWLSGCRKSISSILKSIIMLEEAEIEPEDLDTEENKNLELLVDAWKYLLKRDSNVRIHRNRMNHMTEKKEWENVFSSVYEKAGLSNSKAIVFVGFFYITPINEHIMKMLEKAGFELIFLIAYDMRFPFVYEIWEKTYSTEFGYEPKSNWIIGTKENDDPYGRIMNGEYPVTIGNNLEIKEYASVMEFVDDVKNIRKDGYSIYGPNYYKTNELLRDYFPDEYGDRKILSYPIGQFVGTLNNMWDEELQTIALDVDNLIDCFSSGWLSVNGVSGKQYMQDLMHILPFFDDCTTISSWEKRIAKLENIKEEVLDKFNVEHDNNPAISRWQEAIENPFDNFGMFSVDSEKMNVILTLIKQLLEMAKELFGNNRVININEHLNRLNNILQKGEISNDIYDEEKKIINDIIGKLKYSDDAERRNYYSSECAPSDISRALNLYLYGNLDDDEIDNTKEGFIGPLFHIEADNLCDNKVHMCMCDIINMPGREKEYIWPLTESIVTKCYKEKHKPLLKNIIHIMETNILSNRYFMYTALKSKNVCLSWMRKVNEKVLSPSPYIKIITNATGISITMPKRISISVNKVASSSYGMESIIPYKREKAPVNMIKEAQMAYALCPMKYVLGYVLDKYPTYESTFQQNYAMSGLISAIYDLIKDKGITLDDVYQNVSSLFPSVRKGERRQVYDYVAMSKEVDNINYKNRSECGGKYYTDERLKIHYPNVFVRDVAIKRFGKLYTPDGRKGLDLYEPMAAKFDEMIGDLDPVKLSCSFCPHISYCRNAVFAVDRENYYD